jgi:hypothetical protein
MHIRRKNQNGLVESERARCVLFEKKEDIDIVFDNDLKAKFVYGKSPTRTRECVSEKRTKNVRVNACEA